MSEIDRKIEEEFEKLKSDCSFEEIHNRIVTINELYKKKLRKVFVVCVFFPIIFMLFVVIGFWFGKSVWV